MDPSNNVKAKLLLLTSLLAIILIISAPVVNSVLVNLINPTETGPLTESTTTVFVDPDKIVKDYLLDPGYQIGDTFTVHVNISGVSDLFTWQLNMSWDPSILNVSSLTAGEFLLRTTSDNKTASFQIGSVINATDNVEGYTGMAESVLGNASGISVSGNGRLVSIEFLIVGYGNSDINMSASEPLSTMLLNSTGATITFTPTNGFFRNKLKGDIDGDGDVDFLDFNAFLTSWLKVSGQPKYNREADTDVDGDVDFLDFNAFLASWLKTI